MNGLGLPTNLSLFTGAGGLDIAAGWAGFRTIGYVEFDAYAQAVIMSRIRAGQLDDAPIWDDVKTFDARPYRGLVDVVSGGFPCQPASHAGRRGGASDDRWLWPDMGRIICEARPLGVLAENVPGLLSVDAGRCFGEVLRDLARMGYDAEWGCYSVAEAGAPHIRDRVWILAYAQHPDAHKLGLHRAQIVERGSLERGTELRDEQERELGSVREDVADSSSRRRIGRRSGEANERPKTKSQRRSSEIPNTDADGGRLEIIREPQHEGERGASRPEPDGLRPSGRRQGSRDLGDPKRRGRRRKPRGGGGRAAL